jgi:uncharacterized membrane protein YtjA (UPF0391 family)
MKKNVGTIDKIVRLVIAVVAGYFAYKGGFESAWIGYVLYAVAAIMLLTALVGTCPIYMALGMKSNK